MVPVVVEQIELEDNGIVEGSAESFVIVVHDIVNDGRCEKPSVSMAFHNVRHETPREMF